VREGVDADLVALVHQVLHDARIARDHRADHEERARDVVLLKDLEDLRRPGGVGTVVEGERDGLLGHGLALRLSAPEGEDRPAVDDLVGDLAGTGVAAYALVAADLGAQIAVEQHHAGEREEEQQGEDDTRFLQRRGLARGPCHPGRGAPAAARGRRSSHECECVPVSWRRGRRRTRTGRRRSGIRRGGDAAGGAGGDARGRDAGGLRGRAAVPPCGWTPPPGPEFWLPRAAAPEGQQRGRGERGAPAHERHAEHDRVPDADDAEEETDPAQQLGSAPGVVNEHGTVFGPRGPVDPLPRLRRRPRPAARDSMAGSECIPRILGSLYVSETLILLVRLP
jgi:hypothetical protein